MGVVVVVGAEVEAVFGHELRHEVTRSIAVAQSSCLCRLCVQTSVNLGHLLEDERESIRGGVES
jgi:hypothetical protein